MPNEARKGSVVWCSLWSSQGSKACLSWRLPGTLDIGVKSMSLRDWNVTSATRSSKRIPGGNDSLRPKNISLFSASSIYTATWRDSRLAAQVEEKLWYFLFLIHYNMPFVDDIRVIVDWTVVPCSEGRRPGIRHKSRDLNLCVGKRTLR